MNERMIELSLQAEDYAFDEIKKLESSVEPVISNRVFFKSFKEKFAELIVQQCLDICQQVHDDCTWRSEKFEIDQMQRQIGVNICKRDIKQYFDIQS